MQYSQDTIRHSTAHLLAHAVSELFPKAQVTIGPVIENGFYYDFYHPPGFKESDLPKIEKRMKRIAMRRLPVERLEVSRDEALELFAKMGEDYKCKIIQDIPSAEQLTLYQQGEFIDLCRGPHIDNTSDLGVFKLLKVSGSYWRGSAKNEGLQRIYGTAWHTQQELDEYLYILSESEKRDHRVLGKKLQLFHFQEEAPGMPYWHPHGYTLYTLICDYIRKKVTSNGYREIATPLLADQSLWEASGHWDKFSDHMFVTKSENRTYAIKPMNCPNHVQVYKQTLQSYKDLPLRFSEFGSCHRNEFSGTLHGLLRARAFVQDDAHIFCTSEQIESEVTSFISLLQEVYKDFGFTDISYALATRPEDRVGDEGLWDTAEAGLKNVLDALKLEWSVKEGEGAFYGPKIEFILQDCLKRKWQCGTIQCDFSMPDRLGAFYINSDSKKATPVMIHRAILGSLERFIGILLENCAGILPLWLAPLQCKILTISESANAYAEEVNQTLLLSGIRTEVDIRNEKIGLKIREATLIKIPYLLIIGAKEIEGRHVSVRKRDGSTLGSIEIDSVLKLFNDEIDRKV